MSIELEDVLGDFPAVAAREARERWQRLREVLGEEVLAGLPVGTAGKLVQVLAWSEFVCQVLLRTPDLLAAGRFESWLEPIDPAAAAADIKAELQALDSEAELRRRLRQLRQQWLARIAVLDMLSLADHQATHAAISAVADACVAAALDWLHADMQKQYGQPRSASGEPVELVVLGLGKLGGEELNFSSDIDLIFAFAESGQTDGEREVENELYFTRLGRRLIQVLDDDTADGFVYRVDMRLRPFGDSGPLVMSFAGLEAYYQQHGREWERYAFVKARPIAGDLAAGESLLDDLRPFVYRRYLDYGVFEALRDIKASINREVVRKENQDHVKLGPGGIREAEFTVQLFQLVRGGREAALRQRNFLAALDGVVRSRCLPQDDAERLGDAYRFLRRLENRLQQRGDRQQHHLPQEQESQAILAWSLGFASTAALHECWDRHRAVVTELFEDTVLGPEEAAEDSVGKQLWQAPRDVATDSVSALGYRDVDRVTDTLMALRQELKQARPGTRGRGRVDELMPRLIEMAAATVEPDAALERMCRIVAAVARRTTYLALLAESTEALRQLARICAASDWITGLVSRHPVLLDELIDPRLFEGVPDRNALAAELSLALAEVPNDDLEAVMDVLREFQQTRVLRIAVADIGETLPIMQVSDALSAVAEVVIKAALDRAWSDLLSRHGKPLRDDGEPAKYLVVAYGKLGGFELGYGSDLDLVFMHDAGGESATTEGPRVVESSVFFLRLTQRLIHFLSTPTAAGILYEVDTRLRPSGKGGLLVTSLDAFEKYQRESAWTWEHQALLRSRAVAGSDSLAGRFDVVRQAVLVQPRDATELHSAVADMRQRMQAELKLPASHSDLKASRGGLLDIEFLAQYWVLRHAADYPELAMFPDTIRCLEGLDSCCCLPGVDVPLLVDAYRRIRREIHRQALQGRSSVVPDGVLADERAAVADIWEQIFTSA